LLNHDRVKTSISRRDKFPNVDGFVELVEKQGGAEIPVGKLDVQIKSLPAGEAKFQCPAALVGYAETVALPVLLVCADHATGRVYWRHIHTGMPEYKSGQASFVIHFDSSKDAIDSGESYIRAWREIADDYRKRVSEYPGSVADAIAHDASQIKAIDPRWDVSLNVNDSRKEYTLTPITDIKASLALSGENITRIKEFIDYGKPVQLSTEGITFTGLPLFDHLAKTGTLAKALLRSGNARKVELNIWADGPDRFHMTVPGQLMIGVVGLTIIAEYPEAPFRFEVSRPLQGVAATDAMTTALSFNFEKWKGLRIDRLPYFDKLAPFFNALASGRTLRHELTLDGNHVTGGTTGAPNDPVPYQYADAVLQNIRRAREIAAAYMLKIHLPNVYAMTSPEFESVDRAHAIVFGEGLRGVGDDIRIPVTITKTEQSPADMVAELEAVEPEGCEIVNGQMGAVIYGTRMKIESVTRIVQPTKFEIPEPGRTEFINGKVESAPATIVGVPGSVIIIKRSA
jgi:hypothetical protein